MTQFAVEGEDDDLGLGLGEEPHGGEHRVLLALGTHGVLGRDGIVLSMGPVVASLRHRELRPGGGPAG